MKVIFAKNIGFCSGVKRAVLIAKKSLKKDPKPVQFLGELVHNEKVIDRFKKEGVKFIKNLKEAESGTLIIQAHGFPPFSQKINKKILIEDATCPLVKKVQLVANFLYRKGYQVIILGDKDHAETKGIKGYTKNKAIIMENENQAKGLPRFKKIGFISQTTQNLDKFREVLKILKNKTREIKWFNTTCPEVSARQRELNKVLKKCDGILVIGSRSSANTKRLFQTARKFKRHVFWINSLEELKNKKLKNVSKLGVVSGTSTPDWEIKKIKKWLEDVKQE